MIVAVAPEPEVEAHATERIWPGAHATSAPSTCSAFGAVLAKPVTNPWMRVGSDIRHRRPATLDDHRWTHATERRGTVARDDGLLDGAVRAHVVGLRVDAQLAHRDVALKRQPPRGIHHVRRVGVASVGLVEARVALDVAHLFADQQAQRHAHVLFGLAEATRAVGQDDAIEARSEATLRAMLGHGLNYLVLNEYSVVTVVPLAFVAWMLT